MKKVLLMFAFIATLLVGSIGTAGAQVTYTVYDSTATNSYVPVYGFYCDDYLKCEYVIPADHLTAINGSTISALKFYSSTTSANWGSANFRVFLKEVASPTISAFSGYADATEVYMGSLSISGNEMVVNFTTNYTYNGDNLLIGFYNETEGSYSSASFYGKTISGSSVQGSGSSLSSITASQRNFIPKTTFTVDELHGCLTPTNLAVSGITTNGAIVTWTPGNTENEWVVNCNDVNYPVSGTSSYTVSGLNPSTEYTVKVKAVCGEDGESDWSAIATFATACEAVTITDENPYAEDFNAYTGVATYITGTTVLPNCWDFTYTGTNNNYAPKLVNSSSYGTSNMIVLTSGGTSDSYHDSYGQHTYAYLPGITNDMDELQWQFDYSTNVSSAPAGCEMAVGYVTDIADPTTFVVMEEYPYVANNEWNTLTINLVNYNVPANARLAIRWSEAGNGYYCFIDNVVVRMRPSCPAPTGVTVSNITTTSADIAWTNGGTETEWVIMLDTIEIPADSIPFLLTNLTAATNYTVKVKAICSEEEESDWSNEVSFRTECAAVAAPFYESFEENDLGCWTVVEDNTSYTWHIVSSLSSGYSGEMANGQYAAAMTCSSRQYTAKLISPVLDLSTSMDPHLTFSYLNGNWSGDQNVLSVYYRTDANAEWTLLETYNSNVTSWTEETISLPNPTATYQIAFEGEIDYGYNIHVDAISIEGASCPTPTNVVVSNETETSAEISWTAGNQETAWNLRYKPTQNAALFDFEDGMQGWTAYDVDGDTYNWMHEDCAETPHMTPYEGNGCVYSESYSNDNGLALTPDNWLISPEVELIGSVKFMAAGQDASFAAEHFAVYVIEGAMPATIDSTTISAFTQVGTEQIATGEYTEYTFDLSGHTGMGHVAIRHFNCTDQFVLTIDNVTIGEEAAEWTVVEGVTNPYTIEGLTANTTYEVQVQAACSEDEASDWTASVEFTTLAADTTVEEPCATPANVIVENNVATWESEAENFNLMYVVANDTTPVQVAGNTYTFEGLEDSTVVTVMVQAICDEDNTSDWSEAVTFTFTTNPVVDTCEVPANIAVAHNVVTWESEAENFNLMYVVANDTNTVQVAGNTYTVEGLEEGTVVTVMVQAICDENNVSDWSEATEFTFEGVGINNYGLTANVYPNPTRDVVNVECSAIGANLSVYDMFGKVVMNTTIQSERTELNLSNVAPGVYMIRIANNNAITTVKVVKE